ncbi:MAG: 3-phosphoserine/phosphohydroxythreonine transaminase [Deltaproteobacteria bacterium]|nr:3-phosphoserine/phosphohydroxythreonine transaminase [Deltaproteobacteria bacterium]
MARVINFNAGPAGLPLAALERARDEFLDFEGSGMGILEHSHRGKQYEGVHNEAIALLRELLGGTEDHEVLLLQGGASQAFATVPMNFLHPGRSADYVLTGGWSEKAFEEAQRVGSARVACSTAVNKRYARIPTQDELKLDPSACYAHITTNNTLFGTQWRRTPNTGAVPLVADMSSDFLWRPTDVRPYALIYAGAQKNLGPSGVTVFLIRKDLLATARKDLPKIFRFGVHAENNSLYNTPPTFAVYLMRNVLAWARSLGGLEAVGARNAEKARTLYGAIDARPEFYRCPVEEGSRSAMNVVFRLPTEALEEDFVAEAKKAGMVGLKGHRSVGGIRVSLYNAVEPSHVATLAAFLGDFAARRG